MQNDQKQSVRGWFVEVVDCNGGTESTEFTPLQGYLKAVEFFDSASGKVIALCRLNGTLINCRFNDFCMSD
jgi:hypothetical protein